MAVIGASNSLGGLAGSNSVARLLVVISGDSTPLQTALAKAETSIGGLSSNATSIGNALTRNLSLPLLALGGYAIHAASDFETAIGRIAGLTPFLDQTGQSAAQLEKQLLTLAGDPQIIAGPTDLANALFLAGSAGLAAGDAMDVVKLSAQGMSAGMGQADTISTVLIAALNNYRSSGLTAANAMDILTVAIKDGTAAPDEMAIALGRVLPVAAAAGVSFAQVTASVAALTNLGVPTRVATTSLRALFSELLAPTVAAKKRLDEFGVSAKQLRDTLANNGPIAAFELLQRAVHGNVEALHDIIPQIRGFTAYLGLTGTNAKSYAKIIQDTTHATGAFQKALAIVSKTPEFQFAKGLQELKIAAIEVGQDLLPLFIGLAKVFQQVGSAIGGMPAPLKAAAAAFIALGAVSGPLLKLYGSITAVTDTTTRLATNATIALPSLKALAIGIGTLAVSSIIAVGGFESLIRGSTSLISIGSVLIGTFVAVKLALAGMQAAALKFGTGGILSLVLGSATGGALTAIAAGIAGIVTLIGLAAGASKKFDEAASKMGDSLLEAAKSGDTLRSALKNIEDTQIRNDLLNIAKSAGIMGKTVGEAFAPLAGGLITKIVGNLKPLKDLTLFQGITGASKLGDLASQLQEAVKQGKSLSEIQDILNSGGGAYAATLTQIVGAQSSTTDAQRANAEAALSQIADFAKLVMVQKDYQDAQLATIGATVDENNAIQALADKTGVSVDVISAALARYGVSAAGMSAEVQKDFLATAAGVDKNGNKITLKQNEMEKAAAELADTISKSLVSSFDLFAASMPKAVSNLDAVIKKAQQFGQVAVAQASNVRTLLERGVPSGLIDQFISQGPAMVAAFAGATTPQLNKVVDAYDLAMGAMDASILQEAVHQEGKGKRMVEGFATAILSASNLLPGVGTKIVATVASGLDAGTLKPKALDLITTFVHTLNSLKGITRAAGSKAAQAFADGIASGDFVGPKGKILVQQAARGIAQNSPLTFAEAKKLVQRVADGFVSGKEKAKAAGALLADNAITGVKTGRQGATSSGKQFVINFAQGMGQNLSLVQAAARTIAQTAKDALDAALSNSPYYFTLPMGRKLVTDLYAGAAAESRTGSGSKAAADVANNVYRQFHKAFLNETTHFEDVLDKLKSLVKDNMKKAFDAGDLEMVQSLEKIGKHLEDHLTKLQTRFVKFRQGIRGSFSDFKDFGNILSTAWADYQSQLKDFADAMKQYQQDLADFTASGGTGTAPVAPTAPTAPDFSTLIQNQVDEATRLAKDLLKAQRLGLNQTLLQQFSSQGSAGADALEQLFKNPALIDQLNSAYDSINKVVGKTVDKLGDAYFGNALDFAVNSLHLFALGVVKLIKELTVGLGDANKKLLIQLNALLDQLKVPPATTGAGNGNGNGNGNGGGGESNLPGPNFPHPNIAQKSPISIQPVKGVTQQGAVIYMSGDIVVQGSPNAQETAKSVRRELNRIADRNGGRSGLRGGG